MVLSCHQSTRRKRKRPGCWLDAVQLIDVTDKPWYDADSFPTEYLPGTGSWAQSYAGFRGKLADETISSDAALGDDAEIKGWRLDPASTYVFDAHIRFNSGATPDLQINFGVTQTVAAFSGWVEQVNAGGASSAWWDGSSLVIAGGAADQSLWIRAAIVTDPTNQSTAAFQWAQNSSNGSNTTVYAGSYGNMIKVK